MDILHKFSGLNSVKKNPRNPQAENQEQSLTTILSNHEDRSSLLVLIAACTDAMRKSLGDTFDPNRTGTPEEKTVRLSSSDSSTPPKDEVDPKRQGMEPGIDGSADSADVDAQAAAELAQAPAEAQLGAQERAERDHEFRVAELAGPQMQELEKATLDHFADWRQRVISRVGEAVNKPREDLKQSGRSPSQAPETKPGPARIKPEGQDDDTNASVQDTYAPQETPLIKLGQPERVLILHSVLLLLLSLGAYAAESRVLLLYLVSSLNLPLEVLTGDEKQVSRGLLESAAQHMKADEETKQNAESNAIARRWKVGLGAVAGAALIGVTGGLAAPLLAAGVGSVMGGLGLGATAAAGYLGALAGSAPLVGLLFGAYGGRMTGQMVDEYAKEVSDFAFVPVQKVGSPSGSPKRKEMRRLRVAIGISGWLTEEADVLQPWTVIAPNVEAFALRWELEALVNLGNAITTYIKSAAWGWARSEIIKHTVFAALTAAFVWPLALAKASRLVDNPFSVAKVRSDKAGKILADALINRVQGERPVTLIGYSMGARVIFSCLEELAHRKAFGLVESVVLAGAPTPSDSIDWRKIRAVVAGRVVNVYSTKDYLLAFLYRTSALQLGIAGLQAVVGVAGVENVDVSEMVDGHTQYRFLMGKVLRKIGFEDVDPAEAERQGRELKKNQEQDEEERHETTTGGKDMDAELRRVETKVQERNQTAKAMNWLNDKMSTTKISGHETRIKAEEVVMSEEEKMKRAL